MLLCVRSLSLSSAHRNTVPRHYHRLRSAPRQFLRPGARIILGVGTCVATAFALSRPDLHSDTNENVKVEDPNIRNVPLASLLRSYFVFSVCSVPALVDWSPHVISITTSIPGLRQLALALIRRSFFIQVCSSLLRYTYLTNGFSSLVETPLRTVCRSSTTYGVNSKDLCLHTASKSMG